MRFGHVMIFVTDLEKAKWFYSDLLGLATTFEQDNKLEFSLDGFTLVAFKCEKDGNVGGIFKRGEICHGI